MGILNFSTNNLITGVNIIDNNLYWTDGRSEPKKLEIDKFKGYSHLNNATLPNGRPLVESDVSVIRPHPFKSMEMSLEPYVKTTNKPNPPFENVFPRFSYRWRYQDGQYSPFAPFTQAAYLPKSRSLTSSGTRGDDDWEPTTEEANFVEGYNTTLYNNVGKITLDKIPRGGKDVVEVDILYTESISSTVYVLETLEIPKEQRGYDFIISPSYDFGVPTYPDDYVLLPLKYELSARKVYRALRTNQLSRHFDEVPRIAKAQEITANRLIYGNYLKNYTQPNTINLTNELVSAGAGDGLHVKGNRTYEIGVVYADAYGRQGAMIQAGSITSVNGAVTEQIPLSSSFYQASRQQIQSTITSDPPEWSDTYKYYIKDVSQDFHSLISYNIYNDGSYSEYNSEFVWVEFLSTDRNKITDETVLIPRRHNAVVREEKTRHLVQDIQNEAPDLIKDQLGVSSNSQGNLVGTPLSHYYVELQDGFAKNSNEYRRGNYPPEGTHLYLRDEKLDFSQTQVLGVLNKYLANSNYEITEDGVEVDVFDEERGTKITNLGLQIADTSGDNATSLYVRIADTTKGTPKSYWARINEIKLGKTIGSTAKHRTSLGFELGVNVAIEGTAGAPAGTEGVSAVDSNGNLTDVEGSFITGLNYLPGNPVRDGEFQIEFASSELTEEALERLQGKFWVKVPRNGLISARSEFDNSGELVQLNQVWFETEPELDDSQLDLFWETSQTFCVCTDHGYPNKLDWYNCSAEVLEAGVGSDIVPGVYLESTRINNKFNSVQLVKGVRVNTPQERYALEAHPYGLTWSGIYNSRTGVNRLNEFIYSEGITKELEPNYGSLQKLHTRDTNVIAFCEDKIFRILADKDLLYNADGGGNIAASNRVLGQTTPFISEFGISKNPESFASYGNNIWISDAKRGAVLQVTPNNGQITEISDFGLDDFFRDRLHSADKIIGMYDDYSDSYVISIQGYDANNPAINANDRVPGESGDSANITVKYKKDVQGWPSFVSYIPETGLTLNNKFYTWKGGKMYMHNSNTTPRNNFYGLPVNSENYTILESYPSTVEVVFNDNPSAVKEFLTLSYEGTEGWTVSKIDTESNDAALASTWPFVKKENKYFAPIVSQENYYGSSDQGLGSATADDGSTVYVQGARDKSGIKGFYNKIKLENDSTSKAELFAVNTENFISQT